VGASPQARFVVHQSIQPNWWDGVDMSDALHPQSNPQTLLAHGMNGGDLPAGHGGPLRMRVPRHIGQESIRYVTRLIVTDSLQGFGKGMGSASAERGYSWYNGI
jgi:DMSO/TMAO reductase YedYZ molybdopterin-dependent catalytic subunit